VRQTVLIDVKLLAASFSLSLREANSTLTQVTTTCRNPGKIVRRLHPILMLLTLTSPSCEASHLGEDHILCHIQANWQLVYPQVGWEVACNQADWLVAHSQADWLVAHSQADWQVANRALLHNELFLFQSDLLTFLSVCTLKVVVEPGVIFFCNIVSRLNLNIICSYKHQRSITRMCALFVFSYLKF